MWSPDSNGLVEVLLLSSSVVASILVTALVGEAGGADRVATGGV
jgi:hypothetical protein